MIPTGGVSQLSGCCPPYGYHFKELGFDSQKKANLMVSHINSQPKENLKGKSPLEMMEFLSPDLYKKFIEFGIKKIENDDIILKPYLLKEDN